MKKIKTKPMDIEWKERIAETKWWATGYKGDIGEREAKMLPLRDKLLSLGGEEVCLPTADEDLEKIINRGFLLNSNDYGIELIEGRPSQCHANSCELYTKNKSKPMYKYSLNLMTGYGLSDDGMWREHTWLIDINREYGTSIIETTEKRIAYFGFLLHLTEAEEFCSWY